MPVRKATEGWVKREKLRKVTLRTHRWPPSGDLLGVGVPHIQKVVLHSWKEALHSREGALHSREGALHEWQRCC